MALNFLTAATEVDAPAVVYDKTSFRVNFDLLGRRCKAMIDNGCLVCLVRPGLVEGLQLPWARLPQGIQLGNDIVGGGTRTETWMVELPLQLREFRAKVWCVGLDMDEDLILGSPFVGPYQTHLDMNTKTFHPLPFFVKGGARPESCPEGEDDVPVDFDVTDLGGEDERIRLQAGVGGEFRTVMNMVVTPENMNAKMLELLQDPEGFTDDALPTATLPPELSKFKEVFEPKEGLPQSRGEFDLRIELKANHRTPARRAYKLSAVEEAELKRQLNKMLREGTARPSTSAFAAPVLFVKKGPNGEELRMCFDYRLLNEETVKVQFPLPLIKTLLDKLAGSRWYTTMDLKAGYNQVRICEEDVHKAAFMTPSGLYEPLVMPFGLCNAPALFQKMMTAFLCREIDRGWCVVYIDDILVFGGATREEHIDRVKAVLGKLRAHSLTVKLEKCHFFQEEVEFLGHLVSAQGRRPVASKVEAIKKWRPPDNVKGLRSFLGLAEYYHDNIPGFSHLSAPLHTLTTKQGAKAFAWTRDAWLNTENATFLEAFRGLKRALTSAPCLRLLRVRGARRVTVDASSFAVGAVLEQFQHKDPSLPVEAEIEDGAFFPVAYFSRTLEETAQHWPVRTKELFALAAALKTWRHYLDGQEFEVRTDHQSLARLMVQKDLHEKHATNDRILRMIEIVANFHPQITYMAGATNVVADALSRIQSEPIPMSPRVRCNGVEVSVEAGWDRCFLAVNSVFIPSITDSLRTELNRAWLQETVQKDKEAYAYLTAQGDVAEDERFQRFVLRDGLILYRHDKSNTEDLAIYVPSTMRKEMMQRYHERGHYGDKLMLKTMRLRWYWEGITQDLKDFVAACTPCKKGKHITSKRMGNPVALELPVEPWTHVAMDFYSGMDELPSGNAQVLLVVCMFSKMVRLIPLPKKKLTTALVAEAVQREVFDKILGGRRPIAIVSDRDHLFRDTWKTHMDGIDLRKASKAHPQSDGMAERMVKTMKERYLIMKQAQAMQAHAGTHSGAAWNWEEWLPWVEFYHNSTVNDTTQSSPYQVVYGYVPGGDILGVEVEDDVRHLTPEEARERQWQRYRDCYTQISTAQKKHLERLGLRRREPDDFQVGDYVFVKTDHLYDIPQLTAEDPFYEGPVLVSKIAKNGNALTVERPPCAQGSRSVNIGAVKKCWSECVWREQPPADVEEARARLHAGKAMHIVRKKKVKGRNFFFVSWQGCNPCMVSCFAEAEFPVEELRRLQARLPAGVPVNAVVAEEQVQDLWGCLG